MVKKFSELKKGDIIIYGSRKLGRDDFYEILSIEINSNKTYFRIEYIDPEHTLRHCINVGITFWNDWFTDFSFNNYLVSDPDKYLSSMFKAILEQLRLKCLNERLSSDIIRYLNLNKEYNEINKRS